MDLPVPLIVEGSFPSTDVSASPVYNQVHQGQVSAEQKKFERVQQYTVDQIVHVQILLIQEQIVEGAKEIPQVRFPVLTVEQVVDIPVPRIAEEVAEELSSSHTLAHAAANVIDTAPASVSVCATFSFAATPPRARACNRGKGANLYHQHGCNGAIKSTNGEVIVELNKRTMHQCASAG